jgi:hypothetical protein
MTTIIISRYNEGLNWTKESPFNKFRYIVYNKGPNENFCKEFVDKIITLDNVGRCDHTYLHHVIENYDNLSDIQVFLPGSTGDQPKKCKAICILSKIIESGDKSAYFKCEHKNKAINMNFRLQNYVSANKQNRSINGETKLLLSTLRPLGLWFRHHFGDVDISNISYKGVFSIDKRDILQKPKSFYEKIIKDVSSHSNPEAGHYIERSWAAIFGPFTYTNVI